MNPQWGPPPQPPHPPQRRRIRFYRLLFGISAIPLLLALLNVLEATSVNAATPGESIHEALVWGIYFSIVWMAGVFAWFTDT